MKALFLDVETTGLYSKKHDIWQAAFLVEINGEVVEELSVTMKPHNLKNVESKALDVTGITMAELEKMGEPILSLKNKILPLFNKYIDKFNKKDKFTPIGYNVEFDLGFMNEFFKKCGDRFFGSYQNWRKVDVLGEVYKHVYRGRLCLSNYKLETVCKHFGIDIDAHDALSDIRATRELMLLLEKMEKEDDRT